MEPPGRPLNDEGLREIERLIREARRAERDLTALLEDPAWAPEPSQELAEALRLVRRARVGLQYRQQRVRSRLQRALRGR